MRLEVSGDLAGAVAAYRRSAEAGPEFPAHTARRAAESLASR
jgi:hypothetical protein